MIGFEHIEGTTTNVSAGLLAVINIADWLNILNQSAEAVTRYGGALIVIFTLSRMAYKAYKKRNA